MISVHSTEQASTFALDPEQAADLLLELESVAFEGRIWVESESGKGEVFFHAGNITQAWFAKDNGRAALLRILAEARGLWTVEACLVEGALPIVPSVDSLTVPDTSRQRHWNELCAHAPPVGSVLRLTEGGVYVRDTTTGYQSSVLSLIDGCRTMMQILEDGTGDPINTLELLLSAIEHGLVQQVSASNSLFPLAATEESSGFMPRFSSAKAGTRAGFDAIPKHSRDDNSWPQSAPMSHAAMGRDDGAELDERSGRPAESERGTSPSEQLAVAISQPYLSRARHYIGRYEILMRIGRGGMGTVYLSRLNSEQTGFRRLVALKLLRSHLSRDTQAAQEFLDEARIAGVVHHANVVGVSDAGFHGQQPYLVMDYVEGCSLKQLMAGWPSRSPYFLLPLVIDALAGLHAVHSLRDDSGRELGLVHCDVSPENMLVGVDGMCRLADFGIVRKANRANGAAARGKLGYVSPEQVSGRPFDHRADIFAMGVVLWNSLTGQSLFAGKTVEETLSNICHLDVPTPSSLDAESSAALDQVVMRALSRDPQRRFRSAEDMLAELREAALAGSGLATTRDVAAWVREVAGHELALRRLAILDASRCTTTALREFPSSHMFLAGDPNSGENAPIALTKRVSTHPKPTERTATSFASNGLASPPRTQEASPAVSDVDRPQSKVVSPCDSSVGALFYGAETILEAIPPSVPRIDSVRLAATAAARNTRHVEWLSRRNVLIGIALLLGSLAGYLWPDFTQPEAKPSPQAVSTK